MWEPPILTNFIDSTKAFSSVHRDSLWWIMKSYGIPSTIIDIIRSFYDSRQCAVTLEAEVGKWFKIMTGIKQGCVSLPLTFALVLDWVMVVASCDMGLR